VRGDGEWWWSHRVVFDGDLISSTQLIIDKPKY
jgi:hypothetical protein